MRRNLLAALLLIGSVVACSRTTPAAGEVGGASAVSARTADVPVARLVLGWYSRGMLQPCASAASPVGNADELDRRIREAGLSADDPVYVRVEATATGAAFRIVRIVQVGSSAPVRDCPMTGTTTAG
jgi:hypothetical protein